MEQSLWKIWVPDGLRQPLLREMHGDKSAGHGGIAKTLFRLRTWYYWPGMAGDVRNFIAECELCKCSKSPNITSRPPIKGRFQSERIFQRLYIDFCGPYPRSRSGNAYVFVVLDHLSKFIFFKPMRNATAEEVTKYLETDVFHVFGVPEVIHSDNGRQFTSECFAKFLQGYGVKHVRTAPYAPQANASERVNRSLLAIIRTYLNGEDQRNWDQYVSEAGFALRSAIHEAIDMEPYKAVFGQTMIQHGSAYDILRRVGSLGETHTEILSAPDRLALIRDKLVKSLEEAYRKGQRAYNTRSRPIEYREGQIVYRRNFKLSNAVDGYNAKLASKYLKSVVLAAKGNSLYEIGDIRGRSVGIYHAKDLRT